MPDKPEELDYDFEAVRILKENTDIFNEVEASLTQALLNHFANEELPPSINGSPENKEIIFEKMLEFIQYAYSTYRKPALKPEWARIISHFDPEGFEEIDDNKPTSSISPSKG
jgi:hypothetical protein